MQRINSSTQQMNGPLAAAFSHLASELEASRSMQTSLMGLLGPFRQASSGPDSNPLLPSAGEVVTSGQQMACQDRLSIRTVRTLNVCPPTCSCSCHVLGRKSIPYSMRNFLGWGHIRTRGPNLDTNDCNRRSCRRTVTKHVRVDYIMPTWIALRMVSFTYTCSPSHTPEFLIRFPRLISRKNKGFIAVCHGDLEWLKSLVASGECTPDDIDENGYALLRVRMTCQDFRLIHQLMCETLVCNKSYTCLELSLRDRGTVNAVSIHE